LKLNDEQYWLYAAVDAETNELFHTTLEPTTNTVLAQQFLAEVSEKHDVDNAVFLVDGSHSLHAACHRAGYDSSYVSQTVSVTPQQKQLTTGSARSASHGISLSEHYHYLKRKLFKTKKK